MAMQLPDLVVSTRDIAIRLLGGTPPDKSPRSLGGSGTAMTPTEPAGTPPRAAVMPVLYNTGARPRTNTGVTLTPFEQLRSFADFDLVSIAKKDVKDQILGMEWLIQVRPAFKGQEKRLAKTIDAVKAFVSMPDALAGIEWSDWCGAVADEIMITDALTILPRRNLAGELIGLEQIDGATIVPLVDDRGRPALPPNPAYQQIVRGMPETEFLFGDLLYLPRNRRANSPYGKSNTEHVLVTANLAIRQALHELAFYTDGNVPDGGMFSVKGATADQLLAFQVTLDDIAKGRADMRSGYMRVMPEGTYSGAKDRQWSYEFLEWLARVISWAFGVSPIPIAKQMNRATGSTMESSAMESGPRPIAGFIANVVNRCLRVYGGVTEVEFAWADDEVEDPANVVARHVAYVGSGIMDRNEARQEAGLEPFEFDTPVTVDTPGGPVLLDTIFNPPEPPPELAPKPPNGTGQDAGNAPADNPSPKASADDEDPTAQEKAWAAAFTKYRAAVVVDLKKWKGVVVKRAKAGRAQKAFGSTVIPFGLRKEIAQQSFSPETIQRAIDIFKGELKPTKARSKVEKAIVAIVDGWLSKLEPTVIAWALQQLPVDKLAKKQDPPEDPPDYDAGHLADGLAKQLEAGGTVGVNEAAAAIGVNLERVPENVSTYARRRAGELVGKAYVDGTWIDSTSGSAISDKLRTLVQEAVSQSIEESWTPAELASTLKGYFEISRAKTIARTETAYAYGNGAAELYKSEGVDLLDVKDGPGCLPFGHDDNAPKPDAEKGIVQAESEAEGQVWTVGEYQGAIIGHPNCLIGSELVVAPNVRAAFARRYEGEVIVLRTAADDLLTCTPNHPVLTTRGWLAAGSLQKGDHVIRCSDAQGIAALVDPDHEHVPASIEQVAGALLEASPVPARLVPAAAENFHGDGAGGDVHVVDADSLAGRELDAPIGELGAKSDLDGGAIRACALDALGAAAAVLDGPLHAADGVVGSLGSTAPLFWADADLMEAQARRLGSQGETAATEQVSDAGAVAPDGLGDRVRRLASLITPVEILTVERHAFSGEVFNLETQQGWYVASGIVTHNCVRVATPYFAEGESQ